MKNIFFGFFVFLSFLIKAQVSIGITTPTRILDVNGDLRVRTLTDKSTDSNYNKIIVANSNGDMDAWDKASLLNTVKDLAIENKKNVYFSSSPIIGNVMDCGKMQYRFEVGPLPQMRLVNPDNATIYYTRIQKANSNVNTFVAPNNVVSNITAAYTPANTWLTLDPTYSNNILDEFYMTYPGDTNLYRVTFLARNMGVNQYFYTMLCEKF
ncbi:hypothetical protein A0O34_21210 [Chryseobacterium glaciei]|uniref:Uncharacterized protein n=1 Tax=Chryseobacterium glaciei TaxID=1685010 RepID=A0A172Y0Z2_9FLAO|nr:hypothetical protein [Chryseobacterium glaciei]ANF52884.1 hypothetical protein A0O34_21210 [Chryseobacterium glaciei]